MAISSNRSPSPLSARPIIPRTPENTNSTTRRSFNGNPFSRPSIISTHRGGFNAVTPANSPADSAKRVSNSVGFEDKENELKAAKMRSPLKGSKNFMAPTISASSKITSSSPRKKILVERNDPMRTSITLCDGKAMFFSSNSEVNCEHSSKNVKSMEETETVVVTKPSKKVTFLEVPSNCNNESESIIDRVIMDSEICNDNKPLVSPVIAPLDADPSLPPYDPITNYLSPRPQFRRYEPVPRTEVFLSKDKGLDDSFTCELLSDNFSDIDGSESSQTEDLSKESGGSSSAEMLHEVLDGSSSEEIVVDQEEEEEESNITEPVIEEIAEAKKRTKLSPSTKWKFFSLLLVLMIAFVSFSVTDSPILATPGPIDLRFSNLSIPSDIPVFANANSYFKQFSGEAISYISKLINDLSRIGDLPPLKFMNLTDLEERSTDHGHLRSSIGIKELVEESEPVELGDDGDIEPDEEEVHMEADLDDGNEAELEGTSNSESEEASAIQSVEVSEAESSERDLEQGQYPDMETKEVSVDGDIEPDEEEVHMEADLDDGNEAELEGASNSESEEASAIQSVEVSEAESSERDLEQGQYPDVETKEVSVVLAEGNESDSLERDLKQGLTASNVHFGLADTKSSITDNDVVLESVNKNPESLVKDDSAIEYAQPLDQGLTTSDVQFELAETKSSITANDVVLESVNEYPESLVKDDSAVEYAQPLEMLQSPINRHGDTVGAYKILGISSLVLGLLAAAAAVLHRPNRRSDKTLNPVVHADQVSSKKIETEELVKEKHSSQNLPTEVDVAGESCPTEMSSFQISSFYSKKYPNSVNDEAHSVEKKSRKISRRESLATSEYSTGTPSYGSFTTYEKIPVKHASGGEEVITPVRRSSRIRSHITSP